MSTVEEILAAKVTELQEEISRHKASLESADRTLDARCEENGKLLKIAGEYWSLFHDLESLYLEWKSKPAQWKR